MSLVAQIYESAANAGLLKECLWYPSNGAPSQRHRNGIRSALPRRMSPFSTV